MMKKLTAAVLAVLMLLALFAGCADREVSNDIPDGGNSSINTDPSGLVQEDDPLINDSRLESIQNIIGLWSATEIYQFPRATDGTYDSDEEALVHEMYTVIDISAYTFEYGSLMVSAPEYIQTIVEAEAMEDEGIQVDETIAERVGENGRIVRLEVMGSSSVPDFVAFIINDTYMYYPGDGGYIFIAEKEQSLG